MEKSIKKYYKISEVAKMIGEEESTLRYWEKHFANEINVKKIRNTRYYTIDNIEELKNIKFLRRNSHYTIKGAKGKITNDKTSVANKRTIEDRLKKIRCELVAIRKELDYKPSFTEEVIVD